MTKPTGKNQKRGVQKVLLNLRFTKAIVEKLDRLRGKKSRPLYLAELIEKQEEDDQ